MVRNLSIVYQALIKILIDNVWKCNVVFVSISLYPMHECREELRV